MKEYVNNTAKQAFSGHRGRYSIHPVKRIFTTFLCITFLTANFITASLPVTDISVYAADSKAIVLVNDGVAGNIANPMSGASNWSSVYFGNYYQDTETTKNPVEWNVLSNANKKLFLLADQNLDCRRYNEQDTSITWENCTLRKWLNGEANGTYADNNFIENAFSDEEQSAIATTAVVNDKNRDYNTPGGKNTSDKVFLLSIDEAINPSYGFPDNYIITDYRKAFSTQHAILNGAYVSSTNGTSDWWLRSPGISESKAAFVDDRGYVNIDGNSVRVVNVAVRPAFNINLESVILTSAAVDGKDAGATLGSLKKIASYSGTEWKLTILDSGRNAFTASAGTGATLTETEGYTSWTVPVTCTGATSGTDEHISVILTDSDGKALYYGHIQDSVTIPTGLEADTYTLNVFNEQCNGNYKTDLSSPLKTITLTVTEAPTGQVATPTFSPAAGTYSTAQNVAISCTTGGATIHYTMDGSTPTAASATYNDPINVSETKTIKAIAVKDGMTNSSVASATYTISDTPIAVTGVSVAPTEVTLKPDATKKLTATVKPDNASNKDVTWRSDDEDIASVSSDGTVTAKAEGETYITVTTADGNKSAKCKVIVDKDAPVVETCTISFDANGGKGEMDDQTVDKGVKTQLNKNRFTRDGYSFDSWNTDPDGDGKSYDDKDYITVEKDTTLYAQWKKGKPKHDDDDDDHEDSSSPAPAKPVNPNAIISSSFTMTGGMSGIVKIGPQVQGPAAQAVFKANTPAGWKEAFSFNMTVNDKTDYTLKKGILSFKIPSQYLKAGRKFAILGIDKNGKVKMFPDIDTKDDTITVNIDIEGYAFDLIYFD